MLNRFFKYFMVLWAVNCSAQGTYFKNRYEYDLNDASLNYGVINSNSGGFLTFGAYETQTNSDRYAGLLKLDENGNKLDSLVFRFNSVQTELVALFELNNGYYGITRQWTTSKFSTSIVRINNDLDTIWSKKISGDTSASLFISYGILCRDSSIALTGIYTDTTGYQQILLLKTDTLGNELFLKSYGYANEVQNNYSNLNQTLDGGFIIAGKSSYFHPMGSGYYKPLAIKTDSLGNLQWNFTWGRDDNQNGGCNVKAMSDSTVIVYTATRISSSPTSQLKWNYRKLRYNMSTVWYVEHGPDANNIGSGNMIELEDSGFVVNRLYQSRLWLTRYDNQGNMLWSRLNKPSVSQFTGGDIDFVESDGGFVYSGFIQPQSSLGDTLTQDIFVIKTNCIGWADPPFASATTGSLDNFEVVLENNSMYFGNCFIDWGDGSFDTLYESSDTLIYHTYATDGNFNATIIAEACGDKDTLNMNVVSSLVGITEHEKKVFSVFPNPANGILNIRMENSISNYEIILSDITGKVILRKENAKQIDVSGFANGIYFVSIPELNHTEKIQIVK
jgi:hypothetical protein